MTRLVLVAALALAAYAAWQAVTGAPGGATYAAEFHDARGLLPGNDVLDGGAVVGRVTSIGLARSGEAVVRFRLSDRAAAPRADAVAAIEPADLLGDTYLSLSPGGSPRPLRGAIPTAQTLNAPRLDEVLDALTPPVRDGLDELLFEGGVAMDGHGGALARAAIALRPVLDASGRLLSELDTQNGSLAQLVPLAERAAAQVDSRRDAVGPLLDGLARTLVATASDTGPLAAALAGMPATLVRLRTTATSLSATASAGTALARDLQPLTGPLTTAIGGLPALLARVRAAVPELSGALRTAGTALGTGAAGFAALARAFPVLRRQAPTLTALLGELDRAAPGITQGFFVDFPDEADESGRQPFDPFAQPTRAYWRGAAVFSCEAFGVPVAPGCLTRALANLSRPSPPAPRRRGFGRSEPPLRARVPRRPAAATIPAARSTASVATSTPSPPVSHVTALLKYLLGR